MTTDNARAVIQQLLDTVKPKYTNPEEIVAVVRALNAARAELAKPEPVVLTDEELKHMLYYGFTTSTGHGEKTDEIGFARAVCNICRQHGAALAKSKPVNVTDGEGMSSDLIETLLRPGYENGNGYADGAQLVDLGWYHPVMGCDSLQIVVDNARALLARHGRSTIIPIPLSERMPGSDPDDLDTEGTCWMWHPENYHFCLCRPDPSVHTHWLPYWAIPLPQPTASTP